MTHLPVLIPLSMAMGLIGLGAFLWALRNGQFEDPEDNAWRVVMPRHPLSRKGTQNDKLAPHSHYQDP
jgi:cbb3-type cytochrome oxidase maturation protein